MRNVLIISHSFSTKKSVVGRRWQKFANQMSEEFNVTTLSKIGETDNLKRSIENYYYKDTFPKILLKQPKTIFEKINYRLALGFRKIRLSDNYYDRVAGQRNEIKQSIRNIIVKNQIDSIIVSGAPFHLMVFTVELMEEFPEIKFVIDYRDGWNWSYAWGADVLKGKRLEKELKYESFVQENADLILLASEDLKITFDDFTSSKFESKTKVLINGKDFSNQAYLGKNPTNKILHIGTIKIGTDDLWQKFLIEFGKLNEKELHFYGLNDKHIQGFVKKNQISNIFFHERVDERKLPELNKQYDLCLFFKRSDYPHSFPSKFFDYLNLRLPLILISESGIVSDEIEKNNLGKVFKSGDDPKVFEALANYDLNNFNKEYDYSKFSIAGLTTELIELIDRINK